LFTKKLLPPPPIDDAVLLEGQLLGHPELMKRMVNTMKKEELEA
jgi:hypothetical protein